MAKWLMVGAAVVFCVTLWATVFRSRKPEVRLSPLSEAERFAFQVAAQPQRKRHACVLHVAATGLAPDLCPYEDGAKEVTNALRARDETVYLVAMKENGCFQVEPNTTCSRIDDDDALGKVSYSQVRVLTGTHKGRTGWLPTSQTK